MFNPEINVNIPNKTWATKIQKIIKDGIRMFAFFLTKEKLKLKYKM